MRTTHGRVAAVAACVLLGACESSSRIHEAPATLAGGNQVPPVSTAATGSARFSVGDDRSLQGKLTTQGVAATAVDLHEAAIGSNGPLVIPLARTAASEWSVPPGTRLTDEQFESFRDGRLYVNVRSAAYPGGEIRGQLGP